MNDDTTKKPKLDAVELQKRVLMVIDAKQPISVLEIIAEIQKRYDVQNDDVRAAIFPLVSIGEVEFDKQNLGKLILSSNLLLNFEEVAEMLNVSHAYVLGLLDQGRLQHTTVDDARRVAYEDLQKYREMRDAESEAALDELVQQAQELDLGY